MRFAFFTILGLIALLGAPPMTASAMENKLDTIFFDSDFIAGGATAADTLAILSLIGAEPADRRPSTSGVATLGGPAFSIDTDAASPEVGASPPVG